jgi:hypothetical protein
VGSGDYGRALELVGKAMELSTEIGHRQWLAASTMIYGATLDDLLDREGAFPHLERAHALSREIGSRHWTCVSTGFLASNLIARSELERAQELLDRYVPTNLPAVTLGQRQSWTARAELALTRHQGELAQDILDHLIQSAPNMKPGIVIPRLWLLQAHSFLEQDRPEQAQVAALAARERLLIQPQPRLLWRVDAVLARVYERRGQSAEARQARQRAHDTVQTLSASLADATFQKKFLERASAMIAE